MGTSRRRFACAKNNFHVFIALDGLELGQQTMSVPLNQQANHHRRISTSRLSQPAVRFASARLFLPAATDDRPPITSPPLPAVRRLPPGRLFYKRTRPAP